MKKRVLALITAAVMVLAMMPAMAFAESDSSNAENLIAVNEENFPDENFREFIMDEYVYDEDDLYVSREYLADVSYLDLEYWNISDLTGIEYFKGLTELDCSDNDLIALDVSALINLEYLDCRNNQLISLNVDGLTELNDLYCDNNQLTKLDMSSCAELDELYCKNNNISTLILNSTASYAWMDVSYNNLENINSITNNGNTDFGMNSFTFHPQNWVKDVPINADNFPDPVFREELSDDYNDDNQDGVLSPDELADITSLWMNNSMVEDLTGIDKLFALEYVDVGYSYVTELPELPDGVEDLIVSGNYLTSLPELPDELEYLSCSNNQLTSLPELPDSLESLYCSSNKLTALPALPASIEMLFCDSNSLTSLPALPEGLEELSCYENKLTALPELPSTLVDLRCSENNLKTLPALPEGMTYLNCYENELTSLPALPAKLQIIDVSSNEIGGVLDLSGLKFLTSVDLYNNRITGIKLNPMAKYETMHVSYNAMKSEADVTGRDDISWGDGQFYFGTQKSACDLNGHKYVKKVRKANFNMSGCEEYICSVCEDWDNERYVYWPILDFPKDITKAYTGSVLSAPKFVVKEYKGKTLKQGTDYTVKKVTSAKLKNVGKYKYKITLKGSKYSGYTYAYVTVNPKATSITKVTKPAKKQIKVTWKKRTAQVTGYEVRYSTTKNFTKKTTKTVKVKSYKTTSKTIKKLKAKKKYWVQVRTYKTVKGTKYYSKWSAKKTVTTK